MRRLVPVKGFVCFWVHYRRGVPRAALLIGVLVIIKPGGKVNKQRRLTGYSLCAMPVDARDSYYLRLELSRPLQEASRFLRLRRRSPAHQGKASNRRSLRQVNHIPSLLGLVPPDSYFRLLPANHSSRLMPARLSISFNKGMPIS